MTPKNILRSTLIALVTMTLIAAPATAAAPDRGDESPRWTWMTDLGDLVERVSGLLFGERETRARRDSGDQGPQRIGAADDSRGTWDPNGARAVERISPRGI